MPREVTSKFGCCVLLDFPFTYPWIAAGAICWWFQHTCCSRHVVPALGWMICMLFCIVQQCMQQRHNGQMPLPCERNVMLEQLLLDILCGPHSCACMPAVYTVPVLEDAMCLVHLYCCTTAHAQHALLESMHMSLHCLRASTYWVGRAAKCLFCLKDRFVAASVCCNCSAQTGLDSQVTGCYYLGLPGGPAR